MSINGCIIPGTPIAVDFWKVRGLNAGSFIFFLTHLHGDHIVGLTSTWRQPIYCSELTTELLNSQYGVEKSLLHPLEIGKAHLVPVPTRDDKDSTYITVSVIDANHCPGAVMFLFEGVFGKILHTGDFRYTSDLIEKSILSNHTDSVDVLYLDNTFCHPQCIFPSQHEARMTILKIIQQHSDCNIVLGMRNLGKENLLAWLALSLKEWISVTGKMYERIETLGLPNVFKINDKSLRIRVEPFRLVSRKMLKLWNEENQTIAILPTAIFTGIGGTPFANQHNIFIVPYSDHSSYSELTEFVSKIRPCSVVPIVSSATRGPFGVNISSRANMSCFETYCRHSDGTKLRTALRHSSKLPHLSLHICVKQKTLKRKKQTHKKIIKGVEYDSDDGVEVVESSDLHVPVEMKNGDHYSGAKSPKLQDKLDNGLMKKIDSVINITNVSRDPFLSREEVCDHSLNKSYSEYVLTDRHMSSKDGYLKCTSIEGSKSDYVPCDRYISSKNDYSKSTSSDGSESDYVPCNRCTSKDEYSKSTSSDGSKSDYVPYDRYTSKDEYFKSTSSDGSKSDYVPYDRYTSKDEYFKSTSSEKSKCNYVPYDRCTSKNDYCKSTCSDGSKSDYVPYDRCTSKEDYSKSTNLDRSKSNYVPCCKNTSTVTKPDFDIVKQTDSTDTKFQTEPNVNRSIRQETADCYNHNSSRLKNPSSESVPNIAYRFNILKKYSVKSLSETQCRKKLVAALNKWLSDV